MVSNNKNNNIRVNVSSEIGRLRAVLLHRPGVEIERMTPSNATEALYSDILNKRIVDEEYRHFSGVFERVAKVFYVQDVLEQLLDDQTVRYEIVSKSCKNELAEYLVDELMQHDSRTLAAELIEGFAYRKGKDPDRYAARRYVLRPLYNLFFTRDASSSVFDRVLVNSMSFDVRMRENIIYEAIFEHFFGCETLNAQRWNNNARTEGGDVHIGRRDLLCIGEGIRTNADGIRYLVENFKNGRQNADGETDGRFNIIVQQLPHTPESFIHLDMVYTFLDRNRCMMYEPMLHKTGEFAGKATTWIEMDHGTVRYHDCANILEALKCVGMEMEPVFCGGSDEWMQQREQWHSGANFFSLAPGKVIGYRRNSHTIDAMDKAGFAVLKAEEVAAGKVSIDDYERCVVTFAASELPRGGGGARCMTMPICRDEAF
ncbi:MAG: arginine deiminase [Bacteroidales bacterium]|nr:arginine deiminase [Bacteroidales bacterium]